MPILPRARSYFALPILAALVFAAPAGAAPSKPRQVKSRAKIIDADTIAALSKRGDVAMVETGPDGEMRQAIIFAVLDADPERVFDIIMDVGEYPKFLRTVASTKILHRKASMFSFRWELDVPFVTLKGVRLQRGKKPHVIEVRGQSGNFRGARERWELYPVDGGKRTLAAFYRALDLETGGMLIEAIVDLEPSMEHGLTVATGFIHMNGLRRKVEGREEGKSEAKTGPVPPFSRLEDGKDGFDLKKLEPLLNLGQLALIESYPDGALKQVALLTKINAKKEDVANIIHQPGKFPEFIPNFVKNEATPIGDNKFRLDWELKVPVFPNLDGTSELTIEKNGSTSVIAKTGDIKRGRWRWDLVALDDKTTVPIHYAYSDVREASMLTEMLVDKEPLMEHGIVIAGASVVLSAIEARAEGRR